MLGRGSRKIHGNAYSIPLKYSETFSVYIDHKIMDRNNPSFLARKNWKIRSLVSELNNAINHGDN